MKSLGDGLREMFEYKQKQGEDLYWNRDVEDDNCWRGVGRRGGRRREAARREESRGEGWK